MRHFQFYYSNISKYNVTCARKNYFCFFVCSTIMSQGWRGWAVNTKQHNTAQTSNGFLFIKVGKLPREVHRGKACYVVRSRLEHIIIELKRRIFVLESIIASGGAIKVISILGNEPKRTNNSHPILIFCDVYHCMYLYAPIMYLLLHWQEKIRNRNLITWHNSTIVVTYVDNT